MWRDDAGRTWRRRGELLASKRAKALMDDPATTVLLFGGPTPVLIGPLERGAVWGRVAPFLRGRPREAVGQQDYEAAEFRSDGGERLLALHEYC